MSHKKYRQDTHCLNCGAEVLDKFCPNCGQENLETHENFFHVAVEFISDIFHYDSKFSRSIIPLFTRPGFLTQEYWEGRRVRYIHPLRLFFFITVVFVIACGYFYKHFETELTGVFQPSGALTQIDDDYLNSLNDTTKIYVAGESDSLTVKEIKESKVRLNRQINKLRTGTTDVFKSVKYVLFLLLPVYAIVFKLLYIRRKSFYVDHLIYMMHLQSFIYATLSVVFLLPLLLPLSLKAILLIGASLTFIYVTASLRYLYKQPWWKSILKSTIATFSLLVTSNVFVLIIAAIDAIFIQ